MIIVDSFFFVTKFIFVILSEMPPQQFMTDFADLWMNSNVISHHHMGTFQTVGCSSFAAKLSKS